MSYLKIPNLYSDQSILVFKRCYAMEKIHGTSAHIAWKDNSLRFFSGGCKHEDFCKLFDQGKLQELFSSKFSEKPAVIYGEAYGGKLQGMSKTYGQALRFVAFEVKIEDMWLDVPKAEDVCLGLGIDFVSWVEVATDLELLNVERDKDSAQAIKLGMGEGHMREGLVLRAPFEVTLNNGQRLIAKHKRSEFSERASVPEADPTKKLILENAGQIAFEWVTEERLKHVLDKLAAERNNPSVGQSSWVDWDCTWRIQDMEIVIRAMLNDIIVEGKDEVPDDKAVRKAIGQKTVQIYKKFLNQQTIKEIPNDNETQAMGS